MILKFGLLKEQPDNFLVPVFCRRLEWSFFVLVLRFQLSVIVCEDHYYLLMASLSRYMQCRVVILIDDLAVSLLYKHLSDRTMSTFGGPVQRSPST